MLNLKLERTCLSLEKRVKREKSEIVECYYLKSSHIIAEKSVLGEVIGISSKTRINSPFSRSHMKKTPIMLRCWDFTPRFWKYLKVFDQMSDIISFAFTKIS